MSLRIKVFLVFGSVSIALFFVVNQSLSYFIVKDFSSLENLEARDNVVRVTDMLQTRIDDLAIKLSDWSKWDDTYQYIVDRNEEYVQSNLQNETFDTLHLNLVVIADENKEVIFKRYVRNNEELPFPESLFDHLMEDAEEGIIGPREPHKEIVGIPEGVVIYVAQGITSSDGLAPNKGFIVFAYFFGNDEIGQLARMTHLSVQGVSLLDGATFSGNFAEAKDRISAEDPIFVANPGDSDMIAGYTAIRDGDKNAVMLLEVKTDRTAFQKGRDSIGLFAKFMAFVSVLFILLTFIILDRLVLKKIAYISREIRRIREEGDLNACILLPGKDEFSKLAKEMNNMLDTVHKSVEEQQRHLDETERMNRIMVNRELKMIDLKKEIRRLEQQQKNENG